MDCAKIVIQEVNVSARHLDRSGAVSEDALEAEHVATVRQERSGERVAEDVWRAADLDARAPGETADELMNTARRKARAFRANEQRRAGAWDNTSD